MRFFTLKNCVKQKRKLRRIEEIPAFVAIFKSEKFTRHALKA
jgi:hypothetical protein